MIMSRLVLKRCSIRSVVKPKSNQSQRTKQMKGNLRGQPMRTRSKKHETFLTRGKTWVTGWEGSARSQYHSHSIRGDEGTRQERRNVGSMNCNFSVIFIKSLNQSGIKPCLIVYLVAMWTLLYLQCHPFVTQVNIFIIHIVHDLY